MTIESDAAAAAKWLAAHLHLIPPVLSDEIGTQKRAVVGKRGRGRTARVESLGDEDRAGFGNHQSTASGREALLPWEGQSGTEDTTRLRPVEDDASV